MNALTDNNDRFHDIRPVLDSEVPDTIARLIANDALKKAAAPVVSPLSWEQIAGMMRQCKTKQDFQARVIYPLMKPIIEKTTAGLSGSGWENVEEGESYLYISNHRDIVLDAAFLNILFFDKGLPTTEIAIG